MFEPRCPKCDFKVDSNGNYKCPECGYKFWNSYASYLKDRSKINISKSQKENTREKAPFNFWITSFRFSHFLIKSFILGILAFALTYLAIKYFKETLSEKIANIIWIVLLGFWAILLFGYIYGITNFKKQIKPRNYNPPVGKIYCPKCGKKIDDDSKYCIFCGAKVH